MKKLHPLIRAAAPLSVAAALVMLPTACPPPPAPAPTPTPTRDGGASCALACANLRSLGCPEGVADPTCESVCAKVQAFEMTDLNLSCIASAKSKADVRSCGSVRCA